MEIISGIIDLLRDNVKEAAAGVAIIVAIAGALIWIFKWFRDKRDRDMIHKFLRRSTKERGWVFRSTHAIASATRMPKNRVSKLCRQDKRIKRNDKEKESWRLV